MSFFKKLFAKKQPAEAQPSENEPSFSKELASLLRCPVRTLSTEDDLEEIWETFQAARVQGTQKGFTPVLLTGDYPENLLETIESNQTEAMQASVDGKTWLLQNWQEIFSTEADAAAFLAEPANTSSQPQGQHRFIALQPKFRDSSDVCLAEIPTKNPWEVIRWIPFGGWNECPNPEDMMAVLQYWHEKYGAVPGCITSDTLELLVPQPVNQEDALELAKEQYAFCQDIVDQGCGSIQSLAEELKHSTVWYFWWD